MTDGIFNSSIFNDDIFNTHAVDGGLIISGTQSQQQLFVRRPERLQTVHYTFKIISHLIPTITLHLPNIRQLRVRSFDSTILREAFVFSKMNTAPILKKLRKRMKLEIIVQAVQNRDILTILRLFKR